MNNKENTTLQCQELTKVYQQGPSKIQVLKGVNLSINAGEMVAVVGSSGSGKSTFLHLAGALDTPSSGKVFIKGVDIASLSEKERASFRNKHMGFIYQLHHLMMEFNAEENVAMPLMISGESAKKSLSLARAMLKEVGLENRGHHKPSQLSGGERQRVAIARALVTKPALVLADEPTGNLDFDTAEQIYQLLRKLNKTVSTSFVIVTHDLTLAGKMDRQLRLYQGQLTSFDNHLPESHLSRKKGVQ